MRLTSHHPMPAGGRTGLARGVGGPTGGSPPVEPRIYGRAARRPIDHQADLEKVGIGDGPEAAEHRVDGDDQGGEKDGRGEADAEDHVEARTDGDEELGAPEDLGEHRGDE